MKAEKFSQFFYVRYFHFILLYSRMVLHKATKFLWKKTSTRTILFVLLEDSDRAKILKVRKVIYLTKDLKSKIGLYNYVGLYYKEADLLLFYFSLLISSERNIVISNSFLK